MPRITIDVAFGRTSEHPVMYVLQVDKQHKDMFDENLILTISERTPRRLGGDGWLTNPHVGDVNRGWLYHGVLKSYPKAVHPLARDSPRPSSSPSSASSSPSSASSSSSSASSSPSSAFCRGGGYETSSEMHVAVKWVRGLRAIESLRREAKMYNEVPWDLQGSAVPEFYGLFVGDQDGVDVGCLLLEWCPGNDTDTMGKPTEDILRMRAQAVHALHKAGVHHGQLYERPNALCASDGRHFLRAEDGTIRIVDLQRATMHSCMANEIHDIEEYDSFESIECKELAYAIQHSHTANAMGLLKSVPWNSY